MSLGFVKYTVQVVPALATWAFAEISGGLASATSMMLVAVSISAL